MLASAMHIHYTTLLCLAGQLITQKERIAAAKPLLLLLLLLVLIRDVGK
jgi:hypothetical protein